MTAPMPPLRLIAEPKSSYRERYMCETDRRRNRAQRFVRADSNNPYQFVYPTVEIPTEWTDKLHHSLHIRLTLVTVPNERAPVRCVHPYPIDTEDTNVIKDPSSNALYFPVSYDELRSGRKSFQFTQKKLTKYQLRNHGALRLFNSDEKDNDRLQDPTDVRRFIEIYELKKSQLVFSIATIQANTQLPVIYDISSVFSHVMTAITAPMNDEDIGFRCSPKKGDCKGGDEIIMVIPKIDRRKSLTVCFEHPSINSRCNVSLEFLDTRTILFYSPPCPLMLTIDNPTVSIPIVVTQNSAVIAHVDFIYQSLNRCVVCDSNFILTNSNSASYKKRLLTELDEVDAIRFSEAGLDRQKKSEFDHSHIRNYIIKAKKSIPLKLDIQYPLLDNAMCKRSIDSAFNLVQTTNNYFDQKDDPIEISLLNDSTLNQNKSNETMFRKRTKTANQVTNKGNNLLRVIANVSKDHSRETNGSLTSLSDDEMNYFMSKS
ncbi:unnamed protein product [Rotaria socialis]|uniref:Uncharacterized protein n=1 Tax=Rotaria socialis TaxID=392032 RepID=A0A819A422_9BILA|nr:unnamed protein product [Rotaria socialis]CAF4567688.1 unnamed protein product [Rotaria socialis]